VTSPPLRLGFIGCGYVTRSRHLPALARGRSAKAVALADPDAAVLDAAGGACGGARRYRDPRALLADPDVEAVAVCTPAAAHVAHALAALETGRHVFVEKPLALSLADADRLVACAAAHASAVLVGFNLRWHRLTLEARALLRSGAIGRVRAITSVFADPLASQPQLPEWRRRRAQGGGALLDKGVHHFDLWRFLLADEVLAVRGATSSGGIDDEVATVTARSAGGVHLAAVVMDTSAVENRMTIHGDAGALCIDFYRSDGLELRGAGALPGAPASRLRRAGASLAALAANAGEVRRGGAFDSAYDRQWRHFAAAARGEEPAGCTALDGRAALAIALAALADAGHAMGASDGR
jgi:myo-inositol 2-dehydrogenase/D-chiro-inositol 1-dehydrogenase